LPGLSPVTPGFERFAEHLAVSTDLPSIFQKQLETPMTPPTESCHGTESEMLSGNASNLILPTPGKALAIETLVVATVETLLFESVT